MSMIAAESLRNLCYIAFAVLFWLTAYKLMIKNKIVAKICRYILIISIILFVVVWLETNVQQFHAHPEYTQKISLLMGIQGASLLLSLFLMAGRTLIVGRVALVDIISGSMRLLIAGLLFVIFVLALLPVLLI